MRPLSRLPWSERLQATQLCGPDSPAGPRSRSSIPHFEKARLRTRPSHASHCCEQFDQIESGLKHVERRQIQLLERFSAVARGQIERVRAVLADLQIAIKPEPMVSAPPAPPDTRPTFSIHWPARKPSSSRPFAGGSWPRVCRCDPRSMARPATQVISDFARTRSPASVGCMRAWIFRSAVGTIVRTTASGRVVVAGQSGGYGTLVEVDHGYDLITRYAHLSSTNVRVGQMISAGTVVGIVGSTAALPGPICTTRHGFPEHRSIQPLHHRGPKAERCFRGGQPGYGSRGARDGGLVPHRISRPIHDAVSVFCAERAQYAYPSALAATGPQSTCKRPREKNHQRRLRLRALQHDASC